MDSAVTPLTIVTKSEFARHRGCAPSRVTALIKGRRIQGDALIGEGRDQRIVLEIAEQQLTGQDPAKVLAARMRQDRPAMQPIASASAPAPVPDASVRPPPLVDAAADRFAEARAAEAEIKLARTREQRAAEKGILMRADEARGLTGRAVAQIFESVENWIADAASAVAAEIGCDARECETVLRREWHRYRAAQAEAQRRRRATAPPTLPPVDPKTLMPELG